MATALTNIHASELVKQSFSDPMLSEISGIGFPLYGASARGRKYITPIRHSTTLVDSYLVVMFDPVGDSQDKGQKSVGYKAPSVYVYEVSGTTGYLLNFKAYPVGSPEGRWCLLNSSISISNVTSIVSRGGTISAGNVRLSYQSMSQISEGMISSGITIDEELGVIGIDFAKYSSYTNIRCTPRQFTQSDGDASRNSIVIRFHDADSINLRSNSGAALSVMNPSPICSGGGGTCIKLASVSGNVGITSGRIFGSPGDLFTNVNWDITVPGAYVGANNGSQAVRLISFATARILGASATTDEGWVLFDSSGTIYLTAASFTATALLKYSLLAIAPLAGAHQAMGVGLRFAGGFNTRSRHTNAVTSASLFVSEVHIWAMCIPESVTQMAYDSEIYTVNGNRRWIGNIGYDLLSHQFGDTIYSAVVSPTTSQTSNSSISINACVNAIVCATPNSSLVVPVSLKNCILEPISIPPESFFVCSQAVTDKPIIQ